MNNCGVYSIYFEEILNKYYIGCSYRLKRREYEHLSLLEFNKHPNYLLQGAYNLGHKPVFSIIELCTIESMYDKEIFWINEFEAYSSGFNLTPGGSGVGIGEDGVNNIYAKDTYISILNELVYTNASAYQIAKKLSVSDSVVRSIRALVSHGYLKEICPKEYTLLENKFQVYMDSRAAKANTAILVRNIKTGEQVCVSNRRQVALSLGLDPSRFCKLLNGVIPVYRNWTLHAS